MVFSVIFLTIKSSRRLTHYVDSGLNWVLIHGCHNVSCKCVPNVYFLTKNWDGKTMFKCELNGHYLIDRDTAIFTWLVNHESIVPSTFHHTYFQKPVTTLSFWRLTYFVNYLAYFRLINIFLWNLETYFFLEKNPVTTTLLKLNGCSLILVAL
jgi:hypothetical protein